MDFHPETAVLFASLNDSSTETAAHYLATIDPTTGGVTIVGRTVNGLGTLAWFRVPAPP
jgi:hypothetical protein